MNENILQLTIKIDWKRVVSIPHIAALNLPERSKNTNNTNGALLVPFDTFRSIKTKRPTMVHLTLHDNGN